MIRSAIKGKLALAAAVFGIAAAGTGFALAASAEEPAGTMPERLAERFSLDADEVAGFFTKERESRKTERWSRQEAALDQAVADGVISEEQKGELSEIRNQFREEMSALRETHREKMQSWAEQNGIDCADLRQHQTRRGKGGWMAEDQSTNAATTSPTEAI